MSGTTYLVQGSRVFKKHASKSIKKERFNKQSHLILKLCLKTIYTQNPGRTNGGSVLPVRLCLGNTNVQRIPNNVCPSTNYTICPIRQLKQRCWNGNLKRDPTGYSQYYNTFNFPFNHHIQPFDFAPASNQWACRCGNFSNTITRMPFILMVCKTNVCTSVSLVKNKIKVCERFFFSFEMK